MDTYVRVMPVVDSVSELALVPHQTSGSPNRPNGVWKCTFTPFGMYDSEITLMLLVGLSELGCTAGGIARRGKPLPLPLTVLSTQSPIGTAGPVYG